MTNPKPVALSDEDMTTLAQKIADAMPRPGVPFANASRWADASSEHAATEQASRDWVDSYCRARNVPSGDTGNPSDPNWDNAVQGNQTTTPVVSVTAASWADAVRRGPVQ